MKFSKGILATLAGTAAIVIGVAAIANEGDVTATKSAPLQNFMPNAYGKLYMQHRSERKMAEGASTVTEDKVTLRAYPMIGSTFFDGKLDVAHTWLFMKNSKESTINKYDSAAEATLDLFDGDIGSVNYYTWSYLTNGDQINWGQTGFNVTPKIPSFTTGAGEFGATFSTYLYSGIYGSTPQKTTVKNTVRDYNLAGTEGDEDYEVDRTRADFGNDIKYGVFYKPTWAKGLKISAQTYLYRTWTPKSKEVLVDETVKEQADGYAVAKDTENRFTVSYPISDSLSISNNLRIYQKGFYETSTPDDENRYVNRLTLTATLF